MPAADAELNAGARIFEYEGQVGHNAARAQPFQIRPWMPCGSSSPRALNLCAISAVRKAAFFAWKPDVIFHAGPSFRRVYIRLATQFPHQALIDRPSISTHCDGPSAVPIPACSSRCAATWTASCRCATSWAAPRCTGPIIRFTAIPAEDNEANNYHETESQGTRSKCHCRLRV